MKLEFDNIYYAYLNEAPFKYYISILGVGGGQLEVILGNFHISLWELIMCMESVCTVQ